MPVMQAADHRSAVSIASFPLQFAAHQSAPYAHRRRAQDQLSICEREVAALLGAHPVRQQRLYDRVNDHRLFKVDPVAPAVGLVAFEGGPCLFVIASLSIRGRERPAATLAQLCRHKTIGVVHQNALRVAAVG